MINLEESDFLLLKSILKKYPYKFYAYGSRVGNKYRKFSDLDLCVIEIISNEELFKIQDDLTESDLSIKVDIKRYLVDMDEDFRSLINNDLREFEI